MAIDVNVRRATPLDADAIAEIHVRSWQAAYRGLLPEVYLRRLDVNERARQWRENMETGRAVLFVSDVDGRIAGWCSVAPKRDEDLPETAGELTALYIDPEHWRRGHGRALLAAAIDEARLRKWSELVLWVLGTNLQACTFYERMGFIRDGAVKTESSRIVMHEVRYRRRIDGS